MSDEAKGSGAPALNMEALRTTEERLRLVLRGSRDGYWDWDVATDARFYSPRWWEMLGYEPDALPSDVSLWASLVHPDDEERVRTVFRQSVASGPDSYELEFRLRHKAGQWVPVLSRGFVLRDEDGKPLRVSGTNTDISERKAIEEATRQSEAGFRALFEQAAVGVAQLENTTGRFVRVNERFAAIVGYTREELQGLTFAQITHSDDVAAGIAATRSLQTKEVRRFTTEKRYVRKDGDVVWASLEVAEMHEPGEPATYNVATILDITERKLIEQVQSFLSSSVYGASEEFFHAITRYLSTTLDMEIACVEQLVDDGTSAQTLSFFVDGALADNVTYALANTPCARVVGVTACAFPSGAQEAFPLDTMLAELGVESYVGTSLVGYDGQPIGLALLMSRRPVKRPSLVEAVLRRVAVRAAGELERRRAQEREVGARARAEAERARLELQLRHSQKMDAVGQLAGGVAHDFNNMLGVILGFAEEALSTLAPDAQATADLHEILTAAHRSADLTRQLLAFARKQTIAPRRLELDETITPMLTMLRRLIGENIALVWRPGARSCFVHMDPSQLDQIIANLLVNARDAIVGSGTVTIETRPRVYLEGDEALEPGARAGAYVVLSVRDDGCGMEASTRERIFEPFFTTKTQGQGTGLGLATVYGIASQNDGFLRVESAPGRGTNIELHLPMAEGGEASTYPSFVASGAPLGELTVLLVEDELALLELSRRTLDRFGFRVLAANGPVEAIAMVEQLDGRIDLLVTDVVMPSMSGVELHRRLCLRWPDLKCLFMSGYPVAVLARRGVLDEGVHFLPKPFSRDSLSAKLREVLLS